MRVARTKQGAMRVALTTVVAVFAVLAEPVLGETRPLTDVTVTTSKNGLDGSAIVDGASELGSTSVAIFNDNNENQIEAGADNPWVQIDFGEGNQATIGDVDVYGNLENQDPPFGFVHDGDVGVSGEAGLVT